jgi:iron(III) transport system ATP-binding protein
MEPINLRGLSKHFGKTVAVDNIDLTVPAGSLFFLLGPSGCGKTTLLRMLAGFTDPTKGEIRFGEKDVTHLPANKRNCGMVFQSYALWPHMSVAQNVAFGLQVRKVSGAEQKQRVDAALKQVQMDKYAARKPNELSGGQQQRVALARALVIKPTVLLLDEPLSNLDAKLRLEMRSQIRDVCKQAKITGIYVTHDQKEALSMADHIAVLRDGKVAQVGGPQEMYRRPATKFVADFLGETNFIEADILGKDGNTVQLKTAGGNISSTCVDAGTPSSGKITCSIRPEAIRLLDADQTAQPGMNLLPGLQQEAIYLGEMAQYRAQVGGSDFIKIFEMNPRKIREAGTAVRIAFDPADVVLLKS